MLRLLLLIFCILLIRMPAMLMAGAMVPNPGSDTLKVQEIYRFLSFTPAPDMAQMPLFTMILDDQPVFPLCDPPSGNPGSISFYLTDSVTGVIVPDSAMLDETYPLASGRKFVLRFQNTGKITHTMENLVPFGMAQNHVFITAEGTKNWPDYLCRSKLYRPGYGPVGVVLPDNAWHLGWSDVPADSASSVSALIRRGSRDKKLSSVDRWQTSIEPGGWAEFNLWIEQHEGAWHEGLQLVCQQRWLYDLASFNDSLYQRKDLQWMKEHYLLLLQFAWDDKYYDWKSDEYTFYNTFFGFDSLTGGYDIFTLWPTWPRLGLDQRNQWDMYRDMPGGLKELRKQSDLLHHHHRKYFISYNPWDASGRKEDHFQGMAALLKAIDADGVVLDTRGSSSYELQAAADAVKPGVIMYSEGMAVPKDMPGIVSGRVHDALFRPPPLNLNKLIKPDFAIFRVLQIADGPIHREICCAFFNGYGMEINTMRPGRPDWMEPSYRFLGRALKILRENATVFHSTKFIPLLDTHKDSVYVNAWISGKKKIYTLLSMHPSGCDGPLFDADRNQRFDSMYHAVDIWNHLEIEPIESDSGWMIPAQIEPFLPSKMNTREEGNIGCIGIFPCDLIITRKPGIIHIKTLRGDRIQISKGNPAYDNLPDTVIHEKAWTYHPSFDVEKIVIQSFIADDLLDERVILHPTDIPVLISQTKPTIPMAKPPKGMVEIPAGIMNFHTQRDSGTLTPFIAFPDFSDTISVRMPQFYMDRFPVTNRQWLQFIRKSGYSPEDTTNYLKHWIRGKIPEGLEDHPVVYVGLKDIEAFAEWSGKRLPTEKEWQYAAVGSTGQSYPWGNEFDSTKCNAHARNTLPVTTYPQGSSPFGVEDMIGNIWQWTNDVYYNGSYYYSIIRGGSYYQPTGSIWYVRGGPVSAIHPEMILLMDPGLNRNATLGFRLVKDARKD